MLYSTVYLQIRGGASINNTPINGSMKCEIGYDETVFTTFRAWMNGAQFVEVVSIWSDNPKSADKTIDTFPYPEYRDTLTPLLINMADVRSIQLVHPDLPA